MSLFGELIYVRDLTPRTASDQMALDEALMTLLPSGRPILRTYVWAGPARTIGYFAPIADQLSYLESGGDLARRLTGGGQVEHGEDITYSLMLPPNHEMARLPGGERYRVIHEALAEGLRIAKIDCELAPATTSAESAPAANACFAAPVAWDIVTPNGQKLAGAGQRRRRDGCLHQGSVLAEGLGAEFAESLPYCLADSVLERSLEADPTVLDAATQLARNRYSCPKWTHRR